ncbi:MAG: PilN domain-containing protein [Gammaproteobacteria bacterium]|nr:PilN domain-containing protein [Gammaproteobacteria bacterium]
MPRINLLPWREEARKERQKNFGIAFGIAVAMGAAVVVAGKLHFDQLINNQRVRNTYLESEIKIVDAKIAEIKELQATKQRLINRMQVIEQLQQSRPEVVHLFDELVRTLPDGVYLTQVKQTGKKIELQGVAESNARVSNYMRNIEASDWLENAKLGPSGIQSRGDSGLRRSNFQLLASQAKGEGEAEEIEE